LSCCRLRRRESTSPVWGTLWRPWWRRHAAPASVLPSPRQPAGWFGAIGPGTRNRLFASQTRRGGVCHGFNAGAAPRRAWISPRGHCASESNPPIGCCQHLPAHCRNAERRCRSWSNFRVTFAITSASPIARSSPLPQRLPHCSRFLWPHPPLLISQLCSRKDARNCRRLDQSHNGVASGLNRTPLRA
jgi:hypothetical protein